MAPLADTINTKETLYYQVIHKGSNPLLDEIIEVLQNCLFMMRSHSANQG